MGALGSGILLGTALVVTSCSDTTTPTPPTPGAPAKLAFTIQPVTTLARTVMPSFAVAIEDEHGIVVATADNSIVLAIIGNEAARFSSGTNFARAVNGIATFSGIGIDRTGPGFRFSVFVSDAPGIAAATSDEFEISSGPAAKLAFAELPVVVNPGDAITPAVAVTIQDAAGNTVWRATNPVTLTLANNSSGGHLTGTTTATPVAGVAIFSDLSISSNGAGYTLTAGAPNLSGATSAAFEVRNPLNFVSVSAGGAQTCGIATDGFTYCWGRTPPPHQSGADNKGTDNLAATLLPGGVKFVSLSTRSGNCGLTASGAPYCWPGIDAQSGAYSPDPAAVPGAPALTTVTTYNHACGITSSGAGYCWGSNDFGKLGNGTSTGSSVPVPISGGLSFRVLSAGSHFTCGVATTNVAYCWGYNGAGELGDGTHSNSMIPVVAMSGISFATISAGSSHACGLTPGGDAYCWGDLCLGCRGTGSPGNNAVLGGLKFSTISAGDSHTCALTAAGAAYCWGLNVSGEIGDGSSGGTRSVPTRVAGDLTFATISAGFDHTCGVTTAGAAYCWGHNQFGELGTGTKLYSNVPVRVR